MNRHQIPSHELPLARRRARAPLGVSGTGGTPRGESMKLLCGAEPKAGGPIATGIRGYDCNNNLTGAFHAGNGWEWVNGITSSTAQGGCGSFRRGNL